MPIILIDQKDFVENPKTVALRIEGFYCIGYDPILEQWSFDSGYSDEGVNFPWLGNCESLGDALPTIIDGSLK